MSEIKGAVYLAGGMEKAGKHGALWREEITPLIVSLGFDVWNPYKEELNVGVNVEKLKKLKETDYPQFLQYCHKIVDFDLAALKKCSAVVVLIDNSVLQGAGTYGEITLCRLYGIPVYAWIDLPRHEKDVPAWGMGCITKYATSKSEFYEMLQGPRPLGEKSYLDLYIDDWSGQICDT